MNTPFMLSRETKFGKSVHVKATLLRFICICFVYIRFRWLLWSVGLGVRPLEMLVPTPFHVPSCKMVCTIVSACVL